MPAQQEFTMRWGRKRTHEENLTDRKSFSWSYLLSFSWLSKPRNNTSPKCPSSKLKCASKNPIPDTIRHVSTDQTIAPRRRSVGDADRPLPWCHRRHYSVGGDHVPATSSLTLSHIIPFTIIPNQKQSIPPMSGLYQSVPDPGLHPRKIQRRRRKLKNRLIIAASGDTHRKSFSGRIRSRRYNRASARSPRRGRKDLENFAVVKKSSEPERDFKESMVEMILEKRIGRPEELESLLACYLALNSDEHHDMIVKVFRQVWFEINPDRFGGQRLIAS